MPATQELYDLLFTRAYRPLYPALREVTHALSEMEQEGRWAVSHIIGDALVAGHRAP